MHATLRFASFISFALMAAHAGATVKPVVAPSISKQSAAVLNVTAGSKIALSVTAKGTSPKYQWFFTSNGNTTTLVGNKSTYSITKAALTDAGTYEVVVSNSAGNASANFTVNVAPNFTGKYNMAVIDYNAIDVANNLQIDGNSSSGDALYGTATAKTVSGTTSLAIAIKGYLGDGTGQSQSVSGAISSGGVVTVNGTGEDLNIDMINIAGAPIGFIGTGTPQQGTDNSDDTFVVGLLASTTAPKSVSACTGTYTMIVIGYNATAFSKKNANLNGGDAQIGLCTVSSNGAFSSNLTTYAVGGGDQLGGNQTVTGTVSSTGALSTVQVQTDNGPQSHPVTIKFVTVNGQVIGFTGSFKPIPNNPHENNSGIIIGIKNTSKSPLTAK